MICTVYKISTLWDQKFYKLKKSEVYRLCKVTFVLCVYVGEGKGSSLIEAVAMDIIYITYKNMELLNWCLAW